MKQHVMIDLETLDVSAQAAILSIGAVKFDPITGLGEEFYAVIELQSSIDAGRKLDGSTIKWWMEQSTQAREAVFDGESAELVACAFQRFALWLGPDADKLQVWGNGAGFDNVILANNYQQLGLNVPWKFWNDRCYRTMKNIFKNINAPVFEGTKHNALDDAKHQAQHLIQILNFIEGAKNGHSNQTAAAAA